MSIPTKAKPSTIAKAIERTEREAANPRELYEGKPHAYRPNWSEERAAAERRLEELKRRERG